MKTTCLVLSDRDLADVRNEISQIREFVESESGTLAVRIRTNAPKKSGDLISGIIPSPWEEKSIYPGKVVREVYMDSEMNSIFVKVTKKGKRYYYPASQEYGFNHARMAVPWNVRSPAYPQWRKRKSVPAKYFMKNTFIDYVPEFEVKAVDLVEKVISHD